MIPKVHSYQKFNFEDDINSRYTEYQKFNFEMISVLVTCFKGGQYYRILVILRTQKKNNNYTPHFEQFAQSNVPILSKSIVRNCVLALGPTDGPQKDASIVNDKLIPKPRHPTTLPVPYFDRCTLNLESMNENGCDKFDSMYGNSNGRGSLSLFFFFFKQP